MSALKLIPPSASEVIFGASDSCVGDRKDATSKLGSESPEVSKRPRTVEDGEQDISPKEFTWDQLLKYLATAIALLTAIDLTIQFLRGEGLDCFVPSMLAGDNGTEMSLDINRDQVTYIKSFCVGSLPLSEYYPVFILIQGLFLIAPNYLWISVFGGQFDYFFSLVKKLDRLKTRKTGEYHPRNFEIVQKLENEFSEHWRWFGIFPLYILKLASQLLFAVISIFINVAVFPRSDFNFVFDCPEDFPQENNTRPNGWSYDFGVKCVYPSFRVLSNIQLADYLLLTVFAMAATYGLSWCVRRHKNALGYKEIALFAFASSLRPEVHQFPRFWKRPFSPGIRSDLDFLLMRLFRADSGHGQVFKDILVDKELKRRVEEDHEHLYLTSEQVKDQDVHKKRRNGKSL